MRIITLNVNGIRSAASKGLFDWLATQDADVVCVQETKAQEHSSATRCSPAGYHCYYYDAEKKGYSGVGDLSRGASRTNVVTRLRLAEFDAEGRYLEAQFGKLSVVSRVPAFGLRRARSARRRSSASSTSSCRTCATLKRRRREFILCGDWNIAHKEIDLQELALEPEELRLPARGARLARPAVRRRALRRRLPRDQRASRISTPGGRIAARRGRRTSGWRIDYQVAEPAPARQRARARQHLQDSSASRTTRRSIVDYDL